MIEAGIDIALHGKAGDFALDVAFRAPLRGVTVLYGPSGCGKTTTLRAIAGLNRLAGHVRLGAESWQDGKLFLPVYKRPIGYVFQEASLFPHLDVTGNLRFGMGKGQRGSEETSGAGQENRQSGAPDFDEVVAMLNIGHLVNRSPHTLSGGERQRVAIGRALLRHPQMLLMDEPLSALDLQSCDEIMPFLETMRDRLSLPLFYITHSREEVERLADRLVLMEKGRVIAAGSLEDIQSNPALPFARSRNAAVNLPAQFSHSQDGLAVFNVGKQQFYAPLADVPQARRLRIRIAAGDVSLAVEKPGKSSILNVLSGQIVSVSAVTQQEMLVLVALGQDGAAVRILSRISAFSWRALKLQPGQPVYAQIKGVALLAGR